MISFNFNLRNPWSDRWNTIWYKGGLLLEHKAWEFNGYRTHHIIDIDGSLSFTGDHAGFHLMIGLFGYSVELHIYDTRHWNYEKKAWETYEENLL
jgi:hypothetical protein